MRVILIIIVVCWLHWRFLMLARRFIQWWWLLALLIFNYWHTYWPWKFTCEFHPWFQPLYWKILSTQPWFSIVTTDCEILTRLAYFWSVIAHILSSHASFKEINSWRVDLSIFLVYLTFLIYRGRVCQGFICHWILYSFIKL